MILAAPLLMLGLLALPLLWWLLRALPPAPRVQLFPAIRLLDGLRTRTEQPRKAPPWLLALRIAAGTLLVLGLAQPVLVQDRGALPGAGTLLLVIDNGWAAAPDWGARLQAARQMVDRAGRAGRHVRLLLTARDPGGGVPQAGPPLQAGVLGGRLDDLHPMPWPVDRALATSALRALGAVGSVAYLSDGLATADDRAFLQALRTAGPVSELRASPPVLAVLDRPVPQPGRLLVRIEAMPAPVPRSLLVHGETAAGASLARIAVPVAAGATRAEAPIVLPAELRNQLSRLVLDGMPGAGGVRLLDEGDRRRPVGLLAAAGGDTPLLGALFFLRRALAPIAELREGPLDALLSRQLSVLVAPDGTLDDPTARARVAAWVRNGGMLIRFAGPRLAARTSGPGSDAAGSLPPDPLLPVRLLGGARQLGGAMSWGSPEHPAPFTDGPFAGLPVPAEVTVSRQVLAEPTADLSQHSWARLADGTPLVTHATLGDGQLVLFHVTGTADWSSLPLSGLFPSMLQRLVERAAGLAAPGDRTVLAPSLTLGGDGQLGSPPPGARGLAADRFGGAAASALHPAGLYGPPSSRRSLNIADALPPLAPEAASGPVRSLADHVPDRRLGPSLLALALALLVVGRGGDAASARAAARPFRRRGTPGGAPAGAPAGAGAGHRLSGKAGGGAGSRPGAGRLGRNPARLRRHRGCRRGRRVARRAGRPHRLCQRPHLGAARPSGRGGAGARRPRLLPDAVLAGDRRDRSDRSRCRLDRVAQRLHEPWRHPADRHPGHRQRFRFRRRRLHLVCTGTAQALRRATAGLDIPSLRPVDQAHVLSRSFYLLHAFPGRYVGAPVWVASEDDLGNDGVSPVIIGANDWAGAWAVDAAGQNPYAVIPGGEEQRVIAYRFGVNAVIYALTGNYKTDQVHVPALLQRLGQ